MHALSFSPSPNSVPEFPIDCCPRCDDIHVVCLELTGDSSFLWHECTRCSYLWATPNGWAPESGSVHNKVG